MPGGSVCAAGLPPRTSVPDAARRRKGAVASLTGWAFGPPFPRPTASGLQRVTGGHSPGVACSRNCCGTGTACRRSGPGPAAGQVAPIRLRGQDCASPPEHDVDSAVAADVALNGPLRDTRWQAGDRAPTGARQVASSRPLALAHIATADRSAQWSASVHVPELPRSPGRRGSMRRLRC